MVLARAAPPGTIEVSLPGAVMLLRAVAGWAVVDVLVPAGWVVWLCGVAELVLCWSRRYRRWCFPAPLVVAAPLDELLNVPFWKEEVWFAKVPFVKPPVCPCCWPPPAPAPAVELANVPFENPRVPPAPSSEDVALAKVPLEKPGLPPCDCCGSVGCCCCCCCCCSRRERAVRGGLRGRGQDLSPPAYTLQNTHTPRTKDTTAVVDSLLPRQVHGARRDQRGGRGRLVAGMGRRLVGMHGMVRGPRRFVAHRDRAAAFLLTRGGSGRVAALGRGHGRGGILGGRFVVRGHRRRCHRHCRGLFRLVLLLLVLGAQGARGQERHEEERGEATGHHGVFGCVVLAGVPVR